MGGWGDGQLTAGLLPIPPKVACLEAFSISLVGHGVSRSVSVVEVLPWTFLPTCCVLLWLWRVGYWSRW